MYDSFWDTDFGSAVEIFLVILGVLAVLIGAIIGAAYLNEPICYASTENIDLDVRWSFWGGCQVEIEPDRWIPLENWYYVENP